MTDKEKIKAEIERLMEENNANPNVYDFGCEDACKHIKGFINSLPEEPVSSVWHDAREEPNHWPVLVIDPVGEGMAINQSVLAAGLFNEYNIAKWAYIDDLLHKQEEPVSEEQLNTAAREWICDHKEGERLFVKDAFIAGVKWILEQQKNKNYGEQVENKK